MVMCLCLLPAHPFTSSVFAWNCISEKQKGVCPFVYLKYYVIFITPVCDLLLCNSWSQLHWDGIWAYNHLLLKVTEIIRMVMCDLTCDKIGLTPSC